MVLPAGWLLFKIAIALLAVMTVGAVMPAKLLFLPGASGNTEFWLPVANLLKHQADHFYLKWPGFGSIPADSQVNSLDDLVDLVVVEIDRPCALIAQSMGCIMAIRATLE